MYLLSASALLTCAKFIFEYYMHDIQSTVFFMYYKAFTAVVESTFEFNIFMI